MHERGRHQLSSIDLLPDAADGLIDTAIAALADGRRTDTDILSEFNDALAVIGLGPISKSAFSRYAMAKRKSLAAMKATREVARAIGAELGPDQTDDVTRMLVELLKTAIHGAIIRGETGPKQIMEMARGLSALVAAQKASGEQAEKARASRKAVESAVETTVDAMRKDHPEIDGAKILAAIREAYGMGHAGDTSSQPSSKDGGA